MSDKEKPIPATARPENFYWIMSDSKFMYTPTRQLFEAPAVRRQIGAEAASLVEHEKVCSSQIWAPAFRCLFKTRLLSMACCAITPEIIFSTSISRRQQLTASRSKRNFGSNSVRSCGATILSTC